MTRFAFTTLPPNAWPIAWWPRQTPRIGISPAKRRIAASEIPASFGVQGPGEIDDLRRLQPLHIVQHDQSLLRTTFTSAPSSPKYCTRL